MLDPKHDGKMWKHYRDCKAQRINDQMQCGLCGLSWDIDDDDRPECLTSTERALRDEQTQPGNTKRPPGKAPLNVGAEHLKKLREQLKDD